MLINLWLKPQNNELNFDLPPIMFKQNQYIAISRVFIEWGKNTAHQALVICSTLIDKSSCNPNQQLLFVYQKGSSKRLNYTPTHLEYYKIQSIELQASQFKIHCCDNNKLENIEQIFIQLKVIDERFQQIAW